MADGTDGPRGTGEPIPPSSELVNPNKKTGKGKGRRGKRKQGGQQGHPKHERPEFPPEMLDAAWEYHLSECPVCGDTLLPSDAAPRTVQQIEIIRRPIRIDEHRGLAYWCESCQQVHYAPLPQEVQKGALFGPQWTANLVGYKAIQRRAGNNLNYAGNRARDPGLHVTGTGEGCRPRCRST